MSAAPRTYLSSSSGSRRRGPRPRRHACQPQHARSPHRRRSAVRAHPRAPTASPVKEDPLPDHPLLLIYAAFAAILTALVAALATRVQLLPDVIDLSIIPTGSGLGSLIFVLYGAVCRFDHDRVGRLALLGTVLGGGVTAIAVVIALLADVVS